MKLLEKLSGLLPRAKDSGMRSSPDAPAGVQTNIFDGIKFSNPVTDKLDRKAYELIRRCDAVSQPMRKLAARISTMRVSVVGNGDQADWIQSVLDSALSVPEILEFLAWARIEGYRLARIDGFLRGSLVVPDFRGTGRTKSSAGGWYNWTGWNLGNEIVKGEQFDAYLRALPDASAKRKASKVTRNRYVVFSPWAGYNPEGDTDLTWSLYRIAWDTEELDKVMSRYSDRHGMPHEVLRVLLDKLQPDLVQATLTAGAAKIKGMNAQSVMAMPASDIYKLIEPSGTTWQFLSEYRKQLEARAHKLILGENMTSDTADAGPAGSTKNAEKQLNVAALSLARQLSEALTTDLLPFILRMNADSAPALKPGEPVPYLELRSGTILHQASVAEIVQSYNAGLPISTSAWYEALGMEAPEGAPKVLQREAGAPPMGKGGQLETNDDGGVARPDRPSRDDDTAGEPERKQDPDNDLRNLK